MEAPTPWLDGPMLPKFTLMFAFIYLLGHLTLFKNWGVKQRSEASSCLISLAHGTPAVCLSLHALLHTTQPHFSAPNTPSQNLVLDFSISYFLTDTTHYLLFAAADGRRLFIAHHLAVLYVFATCRVIGHGAFGVLLLLVLAEFTSPCQNAWSLARCRKDDVAAARKLYDGLSPVFYLVYSVVRGVLGPWCVCRMAVFYVKGGGDGVVPVWAWVSWMVVIVNAILLSLLWVSNLWFKLFKERSKLGKLS